MARVVLMGVTVSRLRMGRGWMLERNFDMDDSRVMMPDGTPFEFWDDETSYARVLHVACGHADASDENPGTPEAPLATIGRAAELLQPGEKAVVHGGTYRECVRPVRGGEGPDRMIAYEAAPGEEVRIAGSRVWRGPFVPSRGWSRKGGKAEARIWMGDLPAEWFAGYNPFVATNMTAEFTTFTRDWSTEEEIRFQLRRGAMFVNGRPLRQVFRYAELAECEGSFWVEDPGLRLHFRLWDDADPDGSCIEVTVQEQVFAPAVRGLGFIRVSGFLLEHAGDGIPVPQRALLSTWRGHHWIIENNTVRWANACGIDVGNESWHAEGPQGPTGRHIVRGNRVSDCGACGIAAVGNNAGTLVENNVVERIGSLNLERIWEFGGLKFHVCDGVLIRRNVFRHIHHAPGLWLDYLNRNSRVTENVFADIRSHQGAVYIEVSHEVNSVDNNVIWDVRSEAGSGGAAGSGVNVDTGENCIVAHNFIGAIPDGAGVACHLGQSGRVVGGRTGLCRDHRILNNVFVQCPVRVLLGRVDGTECDGNLFDRRDDATSFCVQTPAPESRQNLAGWQRYYGLDANSRQVGIDAQFDAEELVLTVTLDADPPQCVRVLPIDPGEGPATPGPFELKAGRQSVTWPQRR